MWDKFVTATSIEQTLELLARYGRDARVINGGTDLILEIERKARTPRVVIDVSRIPGLAEIRLDDGMFRLGAGVTHNQIVGDARLNAHAYPLVRACWQVGAPQIRNRGTVAGNVITASPANDTISPLWALGAHVTLQSQARGKREIALEEFMRGVRKTALEPDELLVEITFPALKPNECGTFIKLGLRAAQAISVVNVAVVLGFNSANRDPQAEIASAWITLGAVAPTIVPATEAQQFLIGKTLDSATLEHAALLAQNTARPIDDIRGTADYRREMVGVLVARALRQLRASAERADFPVAPVMLWGKTDGKFRNSKSENGKRNSETIRTTVNGKTVEIAGAHAKTLLQVLRQDLGLPGTKEGCAEGECGACTVLLDGIAVMSCLVPAARADGAEIVTIEGIARAGQLHPVQAAFMETGAVQCGYCTPGFIMSGATLLDEKPQPTHADIQQAFTGNLCRCTGYYKIIEAIERAAQK